MKLSVILISYNECEYLSQAIDSCLNQSFQDIEIIIGDDGSTDGSMELIKSYHSKFPDKIKYFIMDRKSGEQIASIRVSNVIKQGLLIAQGEYIIVLSGDDYFNDNSSFEKQIQVLDMPSNKQCSACVTNYRKFWNNGDEQIFPNKKAGSILYWSGLYIHISCLMFRKEVFDKGLFLNRLCDDTGLEYSTLLYGKWVWLDIVAFSYRQRDKSIMHEADKMELALIELLLLQDVRLKNKYQYATMSRFSRPLNCVFDNRKKLLDEKYAKYIKEISHCADGLVEKLIRFEELRLKEKIKVIRYIKNSELLAFIFKIFRKLSILK